VLLTEEECILPLVEVRSTLRPKPVADDVPEDASADNQGRQQKQVEEVVVQIDQLPGQLIAVDTGDEQQRVARQEEASEKSRLSAKTMKRNSQRPPLTM